MSTVPGDPLQGLTVAIMDPNRTFRLWAKEEIYTGPSGKGRYVPNINDAVWDWVTGLWRVTDVDYTTGLSRLQRHVAPKEADSVTQEDILLGVGPGYQSESYRVYVDTSVMPHVMAIDSRLHFYGTSVSYVKLFQGSDITATGTVVSAFYDQSGVLLGDNIPVELVAMPNTLGSGVPGVDNYAVKAPMVGYTMQELQDNEVVTCVAYDDAGHVCSIARLLVQNTSFIRTTDSSMRYITSVTLESPFLSEADDTLLEFPINLPVSALDARGIVTYSDGTRRRLPIDGTKFNLFGLDNYVATIIGQKIPLVLSYRLNPDEYVYGASAGASKHLSVPYKAVTKPLDGAYSVKLFVFPVWVGPVNGYRLRWFLYNLDRNNVYEVTSLVQFGTSSRSFDPTEYGTVQNLNVAVDMDQVDGRFKKYRHTQTVGITLLTPGDLDQPNWTVTYSPGQDPVYGEDLRAEVEFINVNHWLLDISCGQPTKELWLERLYYDTQPVFNPESESRPPEPNLFVLVFKGRRIECPISQWNSVFTVPNDLNEGEVLLVEFIRRGPVTDLQLGIAGLPVHQKKP